MIDDGMPVGDPKDRQITALRAEIERLRAALDESQQAFALESYNAKRLRAALREIVDLGGAYGTASYAERADKIARAALEEDGDVGV